ncbi:MAG: DUF4163 domain-containing protein [Myroides sp.]
MIKYLLFICLSVGFVSCKKEIPLQITTKTYDLKSDLDCTAGNCTYVHLEIPVASGNPLITQPINDTLFGFVYNELYLASNSKTNSYDSLAHHFVRRYEEFNRTFPSENALAWEANFECTHKNISNKVYQVVFDYYMFTGGAHGLQATTVFLFDLSTGDTIPTKDLFINFEGFKHFAETEFKKQLNISGSLNDAGFTFEKNQFKLPENFYETTNEWILHYNPYEIAPYVQGSTIIKLPKQQVERFLNPLYFKN